MKNIKFCSKLFITVLTFFLMTLLFKYHNTYAIYRETLHTTVNLTILNSTTTHTVTFDANGGTVNGESTFELSVDDGETVSNADIPEPVYDGIEFGGWFIDNNPLTPFDSSTIVDHDMTVVANWLIGTSVARVNGVGYDTLAAAIEAVPEGTVEKTRVLILTDINLSETVTIPNNKWVELDGRNHTISGSLTSVITNNGKLDIISGTITTPNMTKTSALLTNNSGATLNISGGTLNNPSSYGTTEFLVVNNNGGTLNVTGGKLTSRGQSATLNMKANGKINISGGEIINTSDTKGQVIYMEKGTTNISGNCYIENTSGSDPKTTDDTTNRAAVDNVGGTLNITGGTIVSKGWSAVTARKDGATTQIGTLEDPLSIDITTPVLRGKRYGLEKVASGAIIKVYDGIFESLDEPSAISTTNVSKPEGINFKTDAIEIVDGVTYNAAYLLAPQVTIYFYEEPDGTPTSVTLDNGNIIGNDLPVPNPKEGFYFAGWFINGNTSLPVISETEVTGTFNAYAKWVRGINNATIDDEMAMVVGDTFQIEFPEDNIEDVIYSSDDEDVVTIDEDGTVDAVGAGNATVTITGKLSGLNKQIQVTVETFKYTVTFKDGNDVITTVKVEPGLTVGSEKMPADRVKANYIFNGWVYNNNNTITPFTFETQVFGNIDVLVSWKEKINIATLPDDPILIMLGSSKEIIVTATGEGNLVEDYTLLADDPSILQVNGKTIIGASVGTTTLTLTGVESGEPMPLTVNVVNSYNVTFDPDNGETPTIIQVEVGSTIKASGETIPSDPTKALAVFDYWYLYDEENETLTHTLLDTNAIVTNNITYKAKWAGADDVAVINTSNGPVYYTSLARAINGAPATTETEIRIIHDISNVTCSKSDTPATCDSANDGRTMVPTNRNIVINGGTHTLSCGADTNRNIIYNRGTLRIKSGTFLCAVNGFAALENNSGAFMYIEGGLIEDTGNRAAIYNSGTLEITGGIMTSTATERAVVQNANATSVLTMSGGTVRQLAVSSMGAIHNEKSSASIIITGGTITSVGNAIQTANGSSLVIGTQNGTYNATSPIIQGDNYGIYSNVNYSIYDGIIKGKTGGMAVNGFDKITEIEEGANRRTGQDGDYYTLYYEMPELMYHIDFDAGEGTVSTSYLEYTVNQTINGSNFPTPTREGYTFDGWYLDSEWQTPFAAFVPDTADTVTYYAKWSVNNSSPQSAPNNSMQKYFTNAGTWGITDATELLNEPSIDPTIDNSND